MNIKDEVKILLVKKGMTMTELARQLSEKLDYYYSLNNLESKLRRETIKYKEMQAIADVLGYKIEFIEK